MSPDSRLPRQLPLLLAVMLTALLPVAAAAGGNRQAVRDRPADPDPHPQLGVRHEQRDHRRRLRRTERPEAKAQLGRPAGLPSLPLSPLGHLFRCDSPDRAQGTWVRRPACLALSARLLVVAVTPEVPAHAAKGRERNHDRSQDDERDRLVAVRCEERRHVGRLVRA